MTRDDMRKDTIMVNDRNPAAETVPQADHAVRSVAVGREVTGTFSTVESFQKAIDALLLAGFDRSQLSVLQDDAAGDMKQHAVETADDPDAPRAHYTAPESVGDGQGGLIAGFGLLPAMGAAAVTASAGAAVGITVAATVATGGLGVVVGGVLASMLMRRHAGAKDGQLKEGGAVLWVATTSPEREKQAIEVMRDQGGENIHAKDFETTPFVAE